MAIELLHCEAQQQQWAVVSNRHWRNSYSINSLCLSFHVRIRSRRATMHIALQFVGLLRLNATKTAVFVAVTLCFLCILYKSSIPRARHPYPDCLLACLISLSNYRWRCGCAVKIQGGRKRKVSVVNVALEDHILGCLPVAQW